MFKDIVVGVTPSGVDECAADTAFSFAQRFDANLYLVHVAGMGQGWGQIRHLEAAGETEKVRANIEEFYKEKLKGVNNYKIQVVPGVPHNEILRIARKKNSDLIIMGPHTKEYAEKRSKMWGMAGSTLERVSQKARCPVMIVTRSRPYGELAFRTILVATDFSTQAECAVNYGGQMARHYQAECIVFNAVHQGGVSQEEVEIRVEQAKERLREDFDERMAGVANYSFEAWEGEPAMEILKLARIRNADLIIMAHHSKESDPEKAFLGSTVAQVALNATCPTMSVNRHFDLRCGMMYDQTGGVTEKEPATV